jgi:hypothetical protein
MSDMSLATTRWFLAFAKCANLRCGQPKRSGLSGFGLRKGVDLEIPIGLEVGENLRNRITAIRNGYGGIARFVPGASFYAVSPEFWGHVKATWSSTYTARLLTRHYVENSLNFTFNEYFGLSIKHEYRSLPPAFEFVDHKATVSLVVMWAWKK